jgi:hypothetical protein
MRSRPFEQCFLADERDPGRQPPAGRISFLEAARYRIVISLDPRLSH